MSINRGGKDDPARIPGAPASLRVQLSPAELFAESKPKQPQTSVSDMLARRKPGKPAPPSASAPTRTPGKSPLSPDQLTASTSKTAQPAQPEAPPADVRELAASVLQHQQRRRQLLAAQETLILAPSVNIPALKQALSVFGPASWTQVNHERHLAGVCGYPLCNRKPRKPEVSQRPRTKLGPNGRVYPGTESPFRLSISRGTVERNTADDPGGKNAYCADGCWARSEWVRRWVLSDELRDPVLQAARTPSLAGTGASSSKTSILAAADADGGVEGRAQAGRFERAWDNSDWTSIELLDEVEPEVAQGLDGDNPPPFVSIYRTQDSSAQPLSDPSTPSSAGPASGPKSGTISSARPNLPPTSVPTRTVRSNIARTAPNSPLVPQPSVDSTPAPPSNASVPKATTEQLTRKMYTEPSPRPLQDLAFQGQGPQALNLVESMEIHERSRGATAPLPTTFQPTTTESATAPTETQPKLLYSSPSVGLDELLGFDGLADGLRRQVPLESRTATNAAQARTAAQRATVPRRAQQHPAPAPVPAPARLPQSRSGEPDLAALLDAALQVREEEQKSGTFDPDVSLGEIRDQWTKRTHTE